VLPSYRHNVTVTVHCTLQQATKVQRGSRRLLVGLRTVKGLIVLLGRFSKIAKNNHFYAVCFLVGNSPASDVYMPTLEKICPNLVRYTHTYLPMKMEQSVSKRRHIKFRSRGITQKKHTTYRTRRKFENTTIVSFVMSVRLSTRNNSAPTGRILIEIDIWVFFEYLSRKFKFYWNLTRIKNTVPEDQNIMSITSRSVLLRIRNILDENYWGNQNTHFMFNNVFSKNLPFMR
jgi:hypothetical protein